MLHATWQHVRLFVDGGEKTEVTIRSPIDEICLLGHQLILVALAFALTRALVR